MKVVIFANSPDFSGNRRGKTFVNGMAVFENPTKQDLAFFGKKSRDYVIKEVESVSGIKWEHRNKPLPAKPAPNLTKIDSKTGTKN